MRLVADLYLQTCGAQRTPTWSKSFSSLFVESCVQDLEEEENYDIYSIWEVVL